MKVRTLSKNDIAYIRVLRDKGFTQKQVIIIMKLGKSTVSRIWNNLTFKHIKSQDYVYDQELENKTIIFEIISECREIPGTPTLSVQDKAYIKLLKYCNVPYDKVRKLYYDIHIKFFRPVWDYIDYDISYKDFDSSLIGIPPEDFNSFIN